MANVGREPDNQLRWTELYLEPDDSVLDYSNGTFDSVEDAERYQKAARDVEQYAEQQFGISPEYRVPGDRTDTADEPVAFDDGLAYRKAVFGVYEGRDDHDDILDDILAFTVDTALQLDTAVPRTTEMYPMTRDTRLCDL